MLSEKAFTTKFSETLRAELPDLSFFIEGDLQIRIENLNGGELHVSLQNSYIIYRSQNNPIEQIFHDQIKSIKAQQQTATHLTIDNIMPLIKPKAYLEGIRHQLSDLESPDPPAAIYETLNADLLWFYVFDSPDNMRFVSPSDAETLQLTRNDLNNIAIDNLDTYYSQIKASFVQPDIGPEYGDIYLFEADNCYEATALLCSGLWHPKNIQVDGEYVAFLPNRNMLLVIGSKNKLGLQAVSALAAHTYDQSSYTISPYGYIKTGKTWVRYSD